MDPFVYFPDQQVIVCSECKYAVLPSHINTHLRDEQRHKLGQEERLRIIQQVEDIQGLITKRADLNSLVFPPASNPPIPQLSTPRVNGLQCQWKDNTGGQCKFIVCHKDNIRKHCRIVHQWANKQKGRPVVGKEVVVPWRSGVHCQHFFVRGPGSQYFEVANTGISPPVMHASRDGGFQLAKQELEEKIKQVEEAKRQQIIETDEAKEPNLWLRRVGWVTGVGSCDRKQLRAFVAAVDDDEEPELAVLCKAFAWMIQDAQYHAVRDVVGLETLFEANRKEVSKETEMPFDSWMDITTVKRYVEVCQHVLLYTFRSRKLQPPDRPAYELTQHQEIYFDDLWDAVTEFVSWKTERGMEEEKYESEEEIQRMQVIQRKTVRAWVTILHHPLQDDEYKSVLISALAVLGLRADDGWLSAEDYTSKYSAVIKLSRLIVVQEAYQRREASIQQYRERGFTQVEADRQALSYYQLTRTMTFAFMTMAHDGRDPTPMQWIYRSRSYGMKIRYTTTAEGKVQWIGDEILYGKMRFSMSKFRGMVFGLVGEAREVLFGKLMMVGLDAHGDMNTTQVPAIPWDSLVDQPSETKVGWSFLDDERNRLPACKQWWLYQRIHMEETLRAKFFDAEGKLQPDAVAAFGHDVERFLEFLFCLFMLLSQPPRAPELFGMRWKNTVNGGVRNIPIEEGLVSYVAQYHKGYRSSGDIKIIHRYVPREVGQLLVYYLWLVLPFWEKIQFQMTGEDHSSPFIWGNGHKREHRQWTGPTRKPSEAEEGGEEEHKKPLRRPPSMWTSERGRRILRNAGDRWMGVDDYTISANRQILIAISRKYCQQDPFEGEGGKAQEGKDDDADEEEDNPWDLQAGHSTHVGGMIYARELMEADNSIISRREKFRRVSHVWHCYLGFPSACQGVGMGGRAKRKRQVYEEEMQDAQLARWKRLRTIDIHVELEQMLGRQARFRGLQEPVLQAIMKHQSPILAVMATGVGKTLLFQIPARSTRSSTTVVITPLVSLQNHMVERCQEAGISCVKWDARHCHSPSQIIMVTPESAVSKTFASFLDRLQGMCQLDRFVFDEFHTLLDSTAEFRPRMRELGQLVERGVQMVYLTATLPPHQESQIMSTMKTSIEDVHIFRDRTSRPNIAYSVVEYPVDELGGGEIQAVRQMVTRKLDEYATPAKIIIYSSSIVTIQKLSQAMGCQAYYRDVGDPKAKDQIRKSWESANKRVIIATNAFGLGIDQPDVRVVIHVGPVFQLPSYVQESGRAGRDGQRAEAMIFVTEGRQDALQRSLGHQSTPRINIISTEKDIKWVAQQKVHRMISGARCRRIFIDQEMDGRMDRVRCEEGEERCDVCHESDATSDQAAAQQLAYQRAEQVDVHLDGEVDIPSSSIAVGSVPPSSAPCRHPSIDVEEFHIQQRQRQAQRVHISSQRQQESREVWDLEEQLNRWVGRCPICYTRQCQGQEVEGGISHSLDQCVDQSRDVVQAEVRALESIQYARFAGCFDCGIAQSICTKWDEVRDGKRRFVRQVDGICQYAGVIQPAVAAMMIVGPLEVIEKVVYTPMKKYGLWGTEEKLQEEEMDEVKQRMLTWFGRKVLWGSIEASVLLQVFYQLTMALELWEREESI